jgi:hypothetical protein
MRFIRALKVITNPLGQLVSSEQAIPFDDMARARDPPGPGRVDKGDSALAKRKAEYVPQNPWS